MLNTLDQNAKTKNACSLKLPRLHTDGKTAEFPQTFKTVKENKKARKEALPSHSMLPQDPFC